jgi:hypothetical protein
VPLVHAYHPQFVFYVPPKTGSTTLMSALGKLHPDSEVLYDKHGIFAPPSWAEYTHFISVRNPFSRIVSLWQFFNQDMTFQSFLRWAGFRRFRNKLWHALPCKWWEDAAQSPVEVIHMECIQAEFDLLPFIEPGTNLKHLNQAGMYPNANKVVVKRDRDWWDYYQDGDERIVQEAYAEDFLRYDYSLSLDRAIAESKNGRKPRRNDPCQRTSCSPESEGSSAIT